MSYAKDFQSGRHAASRSPAPGARVPPSSASKADFPPTYDLGASGISSAASLLKSLPQSNSSLVQPQRSASPKVIRTASTGSPVKPRPLASGLPSVHETASPRGPPTPSLSSLRKPEPTPTSPRQLAATIGSRPAGSQRSESTPSAQPVARSFAPIPPVPAPTQSEDLLPRPTATRQAILAAVQNQLQPAPPPTPGPASGLLRRAIIEDQTPIPSSPRARPSGGASSPAPSSKFAGLYSAEPAPTTPRSRSNPRSAPPPSQPPSSRQNGTNDNSFYQPPSASRFAPVEPPKPLSPQQSWKAGPPSIVRAIASSTGEGIDSVLRLSDGTQDLDIEPLWYTNVARDKTSSCVLELQPMPASAKAKATVTIGVTIGTSGQPIRCVISTSDSPTSGFRMVKNNWNLFLPATEDQVSEQTCSVRASQLGRYLCIFFYDTINSFTREHHILGLTVTSTSASDHHQPPSTPLEPQTQPSRATSSATARSPTSGAVGSYAQTLQQQQRRPSEPTVAPTAGGVAGSYAAQLNFNRSPAGSSTPTPRTLLRTARGDQTPPPIASLNLYSPPTPTPPQVQSQPPTPLAFHQQAILEQLNQQLGIPLSTMQQALMNAAPPSSFDPSPSPLQLLPPTPTFSHAPIPPLMFNSMKLQGSSAPSTPIIPARFTPQLPTKPGVMPPPPSTLDLTKILSQLSGAPAGSVSSPVPSVVPLFQPPAAPSVLQPQPQQLQQAQLIQADIVLKQQEQLKQQEDMIKGLSQKMEQMHRSLESQLRQAVAGKLMQKPSAPTPVPQAPSLSSSTSTFTTPPAPGKPSAPFVYDMSSGGTPKLGPVAAPPPPPPTVGNDQPTNRWPHELQQPDEIELELELESPESSLPIGAKLPHLEPTLEDLAGDHVDLQLYQPISDPQPKTNSAPPPPPPRSPAPAGTMFPVSTILTPASTPAGSHAPSLRASPFVLGTPSLSAPPVPDFRQLKSSQPSVATPMKAAPEPHFAPQQGAPAPAGELAYFHPTPTPSIPPTPALSSQNHAPVANFIQPSEPTPSQSVAQIPSDGPLIIAAQPAPVQTSVPPAGTEPLKVAPPNPSLPASAYTFAPVEPAPQTPSSLQQPPMQTQTAPVQSETVPPQSTLALAPVVPPVEEPQPQPAMALPPVPTFAAPAPQPVVQLQPPVTNFTPQPLPLNQFAFPPSAPVAPPLIGGGLTAQPIQQPQTVSAPVEQPAQPSAAPVRPKSTSENLTPEEAADKKEATRLKTTVDFTAALQFMVSGTVFYKHHYHNKSAALRHVRVDTATQSLVWGKPKSKPSQSVPLSSIRYVVFGPHSQAMRRRKLNYPWRCFAVVCADRTLDLEATSDELCDGWILSLQTVFFDQAYDSGRRLYSRVSLRFIRLRMKLKQKGELHGKSWSSFIVDAVTASQGAVTYETDSQATTGAASKRRGGKNTSVDDEADGPGIGK